MNDDSNEVLIVVSKLKNYIKDRSGMNTSASVAPVLSGLIRELCDRAIESARSDGRKTVKDRDYNKYASVSRQLQSYYRLCDEKGFRVAQVLLIAPDFSDDFISECEYDHRISLSLITSAGLAEILEGYQSSKMGEFPVRLLMKDGLLNSSRIVKVVEGR